MKSASDFLSKFNNLTPPDDAVRKAVAESVSRIVGVPLTKGDVSLSRGIAFVKCSSVQKSAIKLARAAVFEDLYARLPKARDTVRDIR
ncbi:hypothetical protein A2841_01600 [Candidatus Kaiserbacteria bacterium RIFCSPHIGHO2_01_FULL_48_10]|uniref:Uncharacterized protein n=1 Tax=Candidatus Kaiserbacteria bacterium RIFCSPHIGHO2_01_FULL_48_10 TaxID=1798476 RepID=A0A1F6C1L8_9BACT|nr:MAG: hypothetical protein A2841_01600 [Candidatus Kaiserbacteria bacterium RIFCSPHIGHO2_01_FULL_48_10]